MVTHIGVGEYDNDMVITRAKLVNFILDLLALRENEKCYVDLGCYENSFLVFLDCKPCDENDIKR